MDKEEDIVMSGSQHVSSSSAPLPVEYSPNDNISALNTQLLSEQKRTESLLPEHELKASNGTLPLKRTSPKATISSSVPITSKISSFESNIENSSLERPLSGAMISDRSLSVPSNPGTLSSLSIKSEKSSLEPLTSGNSLFEAMTSGIPSLIPITSGKLLSASISQEKPLFEASASTTSLNELMQSEKCQSRPTKSEKLLSEPKTLEMSLSGPKISELFSATVSNISEMTLSGPPTSEVSQSEPAISEMTVSEPMIVELSSPEPILEMSVPDMISGITLPNSTTSSELFQSKPMIVELSPPKPTSEMSLCEPVIMVTEGCLEFYKDNSPLPDVDTIRRQLPKYQIAIDSQNQLTSELFDKNSKMMTEDLNSFSPESVIEEIPEPQPSPKVVDLVNSSDENSDDCIPLENNLLDFKKSGKKLPIGNSLEILPQYDSFDFSFSLLSSSDLTPTRASSPEKCPVIKRKPFKVCRKTPSKALKGETKAGSSSSTNVTSNKEDGIIDVVTIHDDDDDVLERQRYLQLMKSPSIYNTYKEPPKPKSSPKKLDWNVFGRQKIKKRKRTLGTSHAPVNALKTESGCEYEVEKILDHVEINSQRFIYKIKWRGFSESECTWEPLENLTNCLHLVYNYKLRKLNVPPVQSQITKLKNFLSQHTDDFLEDFLQQFRTDTGQLVIPKVKKNDIRKWLRLFVRTPKLIETNQCELNYLRRLILTDILYEKRQAQLQNLRLYEIEINVSVGNSAAPIYVINNVDLESAPSNFTYKNSNIATPDIPMSEEPVIWCDCANNCQQSTSCCPHMNENECAYDSNGRLTIRRGMPIYECNKNCKCNDNCPNKVIQKGTKVKLAIFKTYDGCGWGVQALEDIPVGQFVTEYVGEILTNKEASSRKNQTYLFNLDFNQCTTYVIDACQFGNISHFLNHSCDPNLAVYAAYIECLDPNLHRLPLFAIRNIKKGEQLTFSYLKQSKKVPGKLKTATSPNKNTIECKCRSENCCGILEIC